MRRAAGVTIAGYLALVYRSKGPASGVRVRAFSISSPSCARRARAALPRPPPHHQNHRRPPFLVAQLSSSSFAASMDGADGELDRFATHTSVDYHHLSPSDAAAIRQALLDWYRPSRRKLPWRGDPPPYDGSTAGINGQASSGKTKKEKVDQTQPSISKYFGAKAGTTKRASATKRENGDDADADTSNDTAAPQKISAYGTWVSEIMLQQTRVEAVIPYYLKWMQSFPTVHDLAAATEEQVNSHWAGLGFYRRARMLHSGAQKVVDTYGGELPQTVEELMTIDGIGRYTASAISSIAHDQCVPVVDGNVCRVLARLTGVANHIKAPIFKDKLGWTLAQQIVEAGDGRHAGEVNQALMELGATYCAPNGSGMDERDPLRLFYRSTKIGREVADRFQTMDSMDMDEFVSVTNAARGKMGCRLCDPEGISRVLWDISQALESSESRSDDASATTGHAAFPTAPPKKAKREEVLALAALRCITNDDAGDGAVEKWLMVKRPKSGLLANQWEFPSLCVWNSADVKKEKKAGATAGIKSKKKNEQESAKIPTIDLAVRRSALDSLLSQIQPSLLSDRACLREPIEHIFSHVRHSYCIEYADITEADSRSLASASMVTFDGREVRFMSNEDMKNVGITSGVKKVLKAVKNSCETSGLNESAGKKKMPRTRATPISPAQGKKQKTEK